MPKIEKLVGPGGPCEGYTAIVLQGDDASPHAEGTFGAEMKRYFDERGWHMFNQAPQGPCFNVCDLLVFPMMSLMEGNSTCSDGRELNMLEARSNMERCLGGVGRERWKVRSVII